MHPNFTQVLLVVQGTGSGKCKEVQTVECVNCGVTIIIEETMALDIDQRSKVTKKNRVTGPVLDCQLDSIKR